jgi:hypothetical protein
VVSKFNSNSSLKTPWLESHFLDEEIGSAEKADFWICHTYDLSDQNGENRISKFCSGASTVIDY